MTGEDNETFMGFPVLREYQPSVHDREMELLRARIRVLELEIEMLKAQQRWAISPAWPPPQLQQPTSPWWQTPYYITCV